MSTQLTNQPHNDTATNDAKPMRFRSELSELDARTVAALAMGGEEKLARRRAQGALNARERIDKLVDPESFVESGMFATGMRTEVRDKSPADGKVAGLARIDGRPAAIVSNDFTVLGASSSVVNGKKIRHMREVAEKHGMPLIFLGESSGARVPDRMGASGRAILGQDPQEYRRTRRTPWVSALLGSCYGSSTWYASLSDFVVMRRGATMAVASSRVTSLAIGQQVDAETLGGWKLHTATTGLVDLAVDSDEDALHAIRTFLGYLPSHSGAPAPRLPASTVREPRADILDLLPESRSKVYDMRQIVEAIVDVDSLFELKSRFGKSIVTALARIDGGSVGIIANNPKFKGGAIDVDACAKVTSFLVLCDSFNIPLIFLVDQPGFLIGLEGEVRGAPGRIMNWINALSQVSVPKFSIVIRKSYGQAYLNMGGGRNSDEVACWPTADLGFMEPSLAVNVLHGLRREDDALRFDALLAEVARDSSAWSLAALYEAQTVLDPRNTRDWLVRMLGFYRSGERLVSQHNLANWPTRY